MLREKLDIEAYQGFRPYLYTRGFLITDDPHIDGNGYPLYGLWRRERIGTYFFWLHPEVKLHLAKDGERIHFLLGHAYDPFHMETEESAILKRLAEALQESEETYWKCESELTGIFLIGWVEGSSLVCSSDAAGMQFTYWGTAHDHLYLSPFSKMVDELVGLTRDEYVDRLIRSPQFKYFGLFLPGDISPYLELRRLQPNHSLSYQPGKQPSLQRYYPWRPIDHCADGDQKKYQKTVQDVAEIMANNMAMIARKWPGKRAAISVTGGKDSTMTLACSRKNYDQFAYFSYISAEKEAPDANGAHTICEALGLQHKIYRIPQQDTPESELFGKIMEHNFGCIGKSKTNEVRKRLFLSRYNGFYDFDVEVKSWLGEIGRARYHKRYHKKRFPSRPSARMLTTLYKIFLMDRKNARNTDEVFNRYLKTYYSEEIFEKVPWWDLLYWEFTYASGEALFLTAEQKMSYDITIPYNNRLLLDKMLSVSLQKRIDDDLQRDVIAYMDRRILDTNVSIIDVGYSQKRTMIERAYLEIHSRLPF